MVRVNKRAKRDGIAYSRWIRCRHCMILFLELVTVIFSPQTTFIGWRCLIQSVDLALQGQRRSLRGAGLTTEMGPPGQHGGQADGPRATYHDIILRTIGTRREASVTRPKHRSLCVLGENTAVPVLSPGLVLHGIIAYQLEQTWKGATGQLCLAGHSPITTQWIGLGWAW